MPTNSRAGPLVAGTASVLVMLLGSSLPWLTVGPASTPVSTGNSAVTAGCGIAIAVMFAWWGLTRSGSGALIAVLPFAALALLIVAVDGSTGSLAAAEAGGPPSRASAGPGIYVTALGATAAILAALFGLTVGFRVARHRREEARPQARADTGQ
jgi:hypothetical protein